MYVLIQSSKYIGCTNNQRHFTVKLKQKLKNIKTSRDGFNNISYFAYLFWLDLVQTAGRTYTRAIKYPSEKLCIETHNRPIPSSNKQITCNNTQFEDLNEFRHL
jgi:hypothetical protein